MKKILILFGLILLLNESYACPVFKFHITFSGTHTFYIENINNPSDHISVTGNGSVDAWSFNSTLGSSCLTFGANICYKIKCVGGTAGAEILGIKFNGSDPVNLVINYDLVTQKFTVINNGNVSAYIIFRAAIPGNSPICSSCNSGILILNNFLFQDDSQSYPDPVPLPTFFFTSLTESSSLIAIEDCVIGADVRLDADPVNGYIIIFPGFSTLPGVTFIAQALDGCGPLIPN
jgi:hypothetical protein